MSPSEDLPSSGEPATPQSAPPEAADSPELPDLSAEDLRDLVPIMKTSSLAEAAFYASVLDNAGIPAIEQGPTMELLGPLGNRTFGITRVCVPRKCKDLAERALVSAREQAKLNAIDDDSPKTPEQERELEELWDLELMRDLEPATRGQHLEHFIARWLAENLKPDLVAQRLAVTGVSAKEATEIIQKVVDARREQFNKTARNRRTGGIIYFVIGAALLITCGLSSPFYISERIVGAGICVSIAGIILLYLSMAEFKVPDWAKPKDPA